MILKDYDEFHLICDYCGEEANMPFEEFYDVIDYKKENGWKNKKEKGNWFDVCPECQRKEYK